jgi:hypothetical protein
VENQQSRPDQSERGQATVEFAITITMTLLLIFGMIDFSRAVYTVSVIHWAAQHGARLGIVESDPELVRAAVYDRMVGLYNCPAPEDCITVGPLTKVPKDPNMLEDPNVYEVQVTVTYDFEFIAPIIAQIVGDSIQLDATASMIAH